MACLFVAHVSAAEKRKIILPLAFNLSVAADYITTRQAFRRGYDEANPFVPRSGVAVAMIGSAVVVNWGIVKHGRLHWMKAIAIAATAAHTVAAIRNYRLARKGMR